MKKLIGIIDADLLDNGTRHPNLALMKLSNYHKLELGNEVHLLHDYNSISEYDEVYISKVFSFTKDQIDYKKYSNVFIGGTGFGELDKPLKSEIEHFKPDYSLYEKYIKEKVSEGKDIKYFKDYINYSIGFMTRGCFRKCDFCVNKKYDRVEFNAKVTEFLDKSKPYIYLWDDNFLAFKDWEKVLLELNNTKKPFQFRQGLDIRLMTEKKARLLSKSKYHGDFIFAFDYIEDKELIQKKLKIWKKHTNRTTKLYVLTAYENQGITDIEHTLERIKILMKHGCLPYIMRYEKYLTSDFKGMYIQLARWCNQPRFFKKMSFKQFAEANQRHHKNKETECSTMRVYKSFVKSYPKVAIKYFDLRYEDLNKY